VAVIVMAVEGIEGRGAGRGMYLRGTGARFKLS